MMCMKEIFFSNRFINFSFLLHFYLLQPCSIRYPKDISTAIVGIPKAIPRTTFAVFLPTPGKDLEFNTVLGTLHQNHHNFCDKLIIFFALFL